MNLPSDFLSRMKDYLGDEYEDFLASYDAPEVKSLRVNTLAPGDSLGAICNCEAEGSKGDSDASACMEENRQCNEKLIRVPWCTDGYIYEDFRPGKHPYHEAGAYYIQEPSAMAPVEYLDVMRGDRVLDLCAAPGGKSTQIAAKLQGEGILISNEIMPDRARILSENIERMGVRNALVISEDPRNISDKFACFFDKVLVDAPCSGEGMFRRSETAINEWSLENVSLCKDRQEWILDEAAKMLRNGGTLVYSTCTFSKEEDEYQIESFLKRHEDFSLVKMPLFEGMTEGENGVGVRLFPHKAIGEGHFVCKLRKNTDRYKGNLDNINDGHTEVAGKTADRDENAVVKVPPVYGYEEGISKKGLSELKDMFSFLENMTDGTDPDSLSSYIKERAVVRFKDQIYLLPKECPSLKGIRVIRPGLHLGTILKNRFEPGHALAMALKKTEINKYYSLNLNENDSYKYINGETFSISEDKIRVINQEKGNFNGWYVIFIDDFSIGWGKITNNIMKNHYPKGLRKMLKQ